MLTMLMLARTILPIMEKMSDRHSNSTAANDGTAANEWSFPFHHHAHHHVAIALWHIIWFGLGNNIDDRYIFDRSVCILIVTHSIISGSDWTLRFLVWYNCRHLIKVWCLNALGKSYSLLLHSSPHDQCEFRGPSSKEVWVIPASLIPPTTYSVWCCAFQ